MSRSMDDLPKPIRSAIGSAVLVATVRIVDAAWRRTTRRPTPIEHGASDATQADASRVVSDRLWYALLLDSALRLAHHAGLPAAPKRRRRHTGSSSG